MGSPEWGVFLVGASGRVGLGTVLGALAVCNLIFGAVTALGGLYGIFWGTLTEGGARSSATLTGVQFPTLADTSLYLWVHVLFVALGVGLILGAAAMVQRIPGGRVLNVLVGAAGIGLLVVAMVGGLVGGPRAWVWGLARFVYLMVLVVVLWQHRVKELWRQPVPQADGAL